MLGSPLFIERQNALDTCIATSGASKFTVTLVANDAVAFGQQALEQAENAATGSILWPVSKSIRSEIFRHA
jgi:hypothetical protein